MDNVASFYERVSSNRGASMVELAFGLPVLLLLIFFVLWLGLTVHARTSIDSALIRSLRLASTRGVAERLNGIKVIPAVDGWVSSGDASQVKELLTAPSQDWDTAHDYYDSLVTRSFPDYSGLRDLPEEYAYFYVYLCQSLKQDLGSSIKCGCDPTKFKDGEGCVSCAPLNPEQLDLSPFAGAIPDGQRKLGFECTFQPAHFLLSPLVGLISLVSGPIVPPTLLVQRRHFYDVTDVH